MKKNKIKYCNRKDPKKKKIQNFIISSQKKIEKNDKRSSSTS